MTIDLGFDQDEIDEQHHEIVLDVFVAKVAAISANGQADVVTARLVISIGVFGP